MKLGEGGRGETFVTVEAAVFTSFRVFVLSVVDHFDRLFVMRIKVKMYDDDQNESTSTMSRTGASDAILTSAILPTPDPVSYSGSKKMC